ncbi:MAG: GAF domain-containing sensor histidine kinase [Candidatus Riflebacteria bacterium]|nr:GAF domain-containing sensor histidine kinase [Candidatus Riflebacteria bacterium]
MGDPRIKALRSAVLQMKKGRFGVVLPTVPDDDVGQLARALPDLAATMASRFKEIETLAQVTEKINAGFRLDEVLDFLYDSFHTIIPYNRIGFALLEQGGEVLRAHWARSDSPAVHLGVGFEQRMDQTSLPQVLATGKPRILNDLDEYLRDHPGSESTRRIVDEGMRASLTCPLVALGRPIGFMFFSSKQPGAYRDVHVELFTQIAGQLAVTVEKGRGYQQLVEINELKNRFLGMAAHDLRSPIGTIRGLVYVLKGAHVGPVAAKQVEFLDRIDHACEGMLQLLRELLDVSAIEAGKVEMHFQETDLRSFLHACHANNELLAVAKSIELTLDVPEQLPIVVLDVERINQAVGNLITNAIKFSHPGTRISLRGRIEGAQCLISVADQGQGIPESELHKLFQDFGRTSVRPTGGEKSTGLGLAIVKRLTEAHGGRVLVESKVGVGSTFTLSLPVRPSCEAEPAPV